MFDISYSQPLIASRLASSLRFARDIYDDSLEIVEDVIDWSRGQLPEDEKISLKALSVLLRVGGLMLATASLTLSAAQLISSKNEALVRIALVVNGLVLTLTGTFTFRIGQLLRQRMMTECRARQKMESVVRKIRLGWREYLLVTEGTTTVEGFLTRPTTVHKYTCTTYVHTERDLKKQSLDHGKTEGQYDARALRPYDEWLPPIDAIVLSPLPVSALDYIES